MALAFFALPSIPPERKLLRNLLSYVKAPPKRGFSRPGNSKISYYTDVDVSELPSLGFVPPVEGSSL
jgi:hypothetical protein